MKLELIENWREAWKWISTNCMAAAIAIQGAWQMVPEDMKASLPPNLVSVVTMGLLALGIAGRLIKQPEKSCEPKDKP